MEPNGYLQIADEFERRIMCGQLKTNDRLPSTTEMSRMFRVSPVTIQRSLTRLVEKGMLKRTAGRGTFVAANVFSSTIGLVLGGNVGDLPSPFYLSLLAEFQRLSAEYHFVTREYVVLDNAMAFRSVRELEDDARTGQLKCVITVYFNSKVSDWLARHENLPFVCIPGLDHEYMVREGLIHLLAQGYRKICLLSMVANENFTPNELEIRAQELEGITKACAEYGLCPDETVKHKFGLSNEEDAYDFLLPALECGRYDAIFVGHDLLLRGAVLAILRSGRKVPDEIGLLSHMNRDNRIFSPFGVSSLLVNPEEIVRHTLEYVRNPRESLRPGLNRAADKLRPVLVPEVSSLREKGGGE